MRRHRPAGSRAPDDRPRRADRATGAPARPRQARWRSSCEGVATALGHQDVDLASAAARSWASTAWSAPAAASWPRRCSGSCPSPPASVRVRGREAADRLVRRGAAPLAHRLRQRGPQGGGPDPAPHVWRNVAITVWHRLGRLLGIVTDRAERRTVAPFVERLEIRTPSSSSAVGKLSGGNQQKVSVAKWLAAGVEVLIVDEPTVGIDIRTKAYLHELLRELADGGTAVLLISSDMPEMVALADRILVMRGCRLAGEVPNSRDYGPVSHAIMDLIHQAEVEVA